MTNVEQQIISMIAKEAEERYPYSKRENFTDGDDGSQAHWWFNEVAKKQREAFIAGRQSASEILEQKDREIQTLKAALVKAKINL